jgi:SAM-dependent methyltransferase
VKRESIYVASIFVSAFLLFLLQPMVARLLLPVFGGSPAVWNTCLVFFQAVLLAGYAYAHGSLSRLGVKRQQWLQLAVLLLSLLMLPRALHLTIAGNASPVALILAALTIIAGVPFFVLSTNSALTQRWFSLSNLDRSGDPFWLYAASNVGSLVALLAYPFIVEPALGLRAQLRWWSVGYGVFVVLSVIVMLLTRRTLVSNDAHDREVADLAPIAWPRRARWILLAAIASSLLLSITMQIATDLVSAPLFWVVPLAIYLLTFVVAFSTGRRPTRRLLAFLTTIGIALCFTIVMAPSVLPLWFALVVLLGTLFTGALLCHSDLADDRPAPSQLTDFYLALSIGGAIGGIANSIVAPLIFKSVVEFPLTLVALALVLRPLGRPTRAEIMFGVSAVAATVVAGVLVTMQRAHPEAMHGALHWQLMPLVVLAAGVLMSSRSTVFPIATTLSALFVATGLHFVDPIIDEGRSFFGVSRVTETADARIMVHGVTVHGAQFKDPSRRDIPVSYYYPRGPLGWAVSSVHPGGEIGIVGLGAGSLAPLARGGQRITYFEIDPRVEQMARRDFTYLDDVHGPLSIQIGDGRQLLEREPDGRFDLLVIDAFNSDAIPMHLLTDEALALYLRKLKPGGLLVMHISNRYADLSRVFRGWRQTTGMRVAINQFVPTPQEEAMGVLATVAVAIGHSPAALAPLAATKQWYWLEDDGPVVHWTDDHSNLLSVLDKNVLKP